MEYTEFVLYTMLIINKGFYYAYKLRPNGHTVRNTVRQMEREQLFVIVNLICINFD